MSTIQNTHTGQGPQNNNNAAYQNINYGEVNNSLNMTVSEPLKRLWDAIAGVGASHRAEHQFARGACLEGTREAVLAILREWGLTEDQLLPICWLSGAAGVGKSSIALSIAKLYEEKGVLVSSFFFFRSDNKRNTPSALIPTIAYGLAMTIPLMRNYIEERISRDPAILEAALEVQFRELVLELTLKWSRQRAIWGSSVGPHIVILDGLDECGDEETQLRILDIIRSAYEQTPEFPLRFLICSRPEAWLREAFCDEHLHRLSKVVVLDDSFEPNRDIREYYLHHFREIASSPKYNHIPFPSPWPSERDLEILVERACGQFVYAATVIRFITLAYDHPITQLRIIIDKAPSRRPGTSPYQQLDVLYEFILSVNPDREGLLSVLAAVLVFPEGGLHNMRSPACIELMLGLPEGQVELTLRSMHSVLDIRGRGDEICAHHTSFTDYLADQTRSLDYHINKRKWKRPLARQWLQNLASSRIRTYSLSQLYSGETRSFFKQWVEFCTSITKPSWKLLVDVQNVDLSFMCVHTGTVSDEVWKVMFSALLPWLEKYGVPKHGSFKDKDKEYLMQRFRKRPECFHLEWPPGACPSDDAMFWVVEAATGCIHVEGRKPSDPCQMPYLTDCRCDLSGGIRSCDPQHVAYQEACMQLVRSCVPRLEQIIQNRLPGMRPYMPPVLQQFFDNLAHSLLLKHCHLDTELLSLCRTFFELVERCVKVGVISLGHVPGAKWKLVEWVEAFPDRFAEERESLKAQFLALCK
ncbi:hypothetical protein PM082_000658 [Marasmius tenuissimus]|nr:hypothetical protein PM082_000658 [Marasmius tenuissimus]